MTLSHEHHFLELSLCVLVSAYASVKAVVTRLTELTFGIIIEAIIQVEEAVPVASAQSCEVRLAVLADAPSMIANVQSVAREGLYLATERAPWSLQQLEQMLWDNGLHQQILVAEMAGQVVGDLWLDRGRLFKSRHTATVGMSIIASHRGRGIGRALLADAIERAEAWGVEKLVLSVFGSNQAAIGLYLSLGFMEEGRRLRQYRLSGGDVDEVMMAKWLV